MELHSVLCQHISNSVKTLTELFWLDVKTLFSSTLHT